MQGMGNFRLGRRTVMYTVETIPKGKNRVLGFIVSGCLSIGAEKSPTECAVKGSQAMNIISAIFAFLGILAFIVDLSINGPFHSDDNYVYLLVMTGNRIAIVLLTFTIVEFCIASATAYFWCRATRSDSNEAILIDPNTIRTDNEIPSVESSIHCPPSSNDVSYDLKVEAV
ncbi:membrane-spanning 4-domains subfamily A member 12-like isoform X2 [Candoia aspera]|uniref:membrane-spanning 4-domains subfamily A member 12-like isoform X2 n=1 Tax=Candoia aspera TaxID=51853 RepID=UPI002FD87210